MEEVPLLLNLMDKAVRQYALYGSQHPQAQGAMETWQARLKDFFTHKDSLDLTVQRTEFEWEGEAIFKLEKQENNYLQEMYIDGVRKIEFIRDVTNEELSRFISVLARDAHEYELGEDDTVTLLWKQAFDHIRYETIDVYAGDLNALLREEMREEDMSESEQEEKNYLDTFIRKLIDSEAPTLSLPSKEARPATLEQAIQTPVPTERFHLDPKTQETLEQDALRVAKQDYQSDVGAVFSEILEEEDNPDDLDRLLTTYLGMIQGQLKEGQLKEASAWLKRLRGVQMYVGQKDPDFHVQVEEAIATMATRDFFHEVGEHFARGLSAAPEDWVELFRYLGDRAAPAVCEVLACISQETVHTTLTDFLLQFARDKADIYQEYLKRPEWMLVRDIVRILGELLDGSRLVETLKPVAVHPRPTVRKEVIKVSAKLSPQESQPFWLRALGDADSDVRMAAILWIGKSTRAEYSRPLAEEIKKESFLDREKTEQKAIIYAFVQCAKKDALDFLTQIATEGGTSDAEQDLRVLAVHGLAEIQDPSVDKRLQELSSKLILLSSVKEAAKAMIKRRASGKKETDNE